MSLRLSEYGLVSSMADETSNVAGESLAGSFRLEHVCNEIVFLVLRSSIPLIIAFV